MFEHKRRIFSDRSGARYLQSTLLGWSLLVCGSNAVKAAGVPRLNDARTGGTGRGLLWSSLRRTASFAPSIQCAVFSGEEVEDNSDSLMKAVLEYW